MAYYDFDKKKGFAIISNSVLRDKKMSLKAKAVFSIMITLPKTGSLRDFMTSKICMTISRMGFLISCISHMFTFMTFFVFSLKVKLYVPTFIIISFGNFLGFFVICILLNIITELPLRLIVKKILRIGRKRESIII